MLTPSATTRRCNALHHATPSSSLRLSDAGGVGALVAGVVAKAASTWPLVADKCIALVGELAGAVREEVTLPMLGLWGRVFFAFGDLFLFGQVRTSRFAFR